MQPACQLLKVNEKLVECVASMAAECATMKSKAEGLRESLPSLKQVLAAPSIPSGAKSLSQNQSMAAESESPPLEESLGDEHQSRISGSETDLSSECEALENRSYFPARKTPWLTSGRPVPENATEPTREGQVLSGDNQPEDTTEELPHQSRSEDSNISIDVISTDEENRKYNFCSL